MAAHRGDSCPIRGRVGVLAYVVRTAAAIGHSRTLGKNIARRRCALFFFACLCPLALSCDGHGNYRGRAVAGWQKYLLGCYKPFEPLLNMEARAPWDFRSGAGRKVPGLSHAQAH